MTKKSPVKYNVAVPVRKYTDHQGQEKTYWRTVGELNVWHNEDGSCQRDLLLYHSPDTKFKLFENTQKHDNKAIPEATSTASEEEINIDDLNF